MTWYSPLEEAAISKHISSSSESDEEGKFGREKAEHMWGRSGSTGKSMRVSKDCEVGAAQILLEDRIAMQRYAVSKG